MQLQLFMERVNIPGFDFLLRMSNLLSYKAKNNRLVEIFARLIFILMLSLSSTKKNYLKTNPWLDGPVAEPCYLTFTNPHFVLWT